MRVTVIGATGHIGSYLVPRLVDEGLEVIAVSRKQQAPYNPHSAWQSVQSIALDREPLEAQGSFGRQIAELQSDIVIDLICFTLDSAQQLAQAMAGSVSHLLHCGTIWVYGQCGQLPVGEDQPRHPLGEYGRNKAAIETWLLEQAREAGLPATVIHPGHIVGPGWTPLNPAGNFNPQLFEDIAAGRELLLPDCQEKTLHHVHAEDVAQAFIQAIRCPERAIGESFNAVADRALTLAEYTQGLIDNSGKSAPVSYLPLEQWRNQVSEQDYAASLEHLAHSSNCSNHKARELLEFRPQYTALEAILNSLYP